MSWCYSWNFSINLKLFLNKKKENGDKKPYKNYVYGKSMCVYIGQQPRGRMFQTSMASAFPCVHSSFLQKQPPDFISGSCPSPTPGPCVAGVGTCPGQLAYFICLATVVGLGKGSSQPNIGQHWDFFFSETIVKEAVFLLGLLNFWKINLGWLATTTWSWTVSGHRKAFQRQGKRREKETESS